MLVFKKEKTQKLSLLEERSFKLEKDIQHLFEQNLSEITSYDFVKSEFSIKNYRIDTLAFDEENNSFVIIEYKRNQNISLVDQGISYLNLMLENKGEFILEYNEKNEKKPLKRNEVDWSQSKIIFVSPSFTDFQIQATNFKDLPIELWEINQFNQDIITFKQIKKSKSAPSVKQIKVTQDSSLDKLTKEIKIYTEQEHLENQSDEIKELYDEFRQAILKLDSEIEIVAKKVYIAFKKKSNIVDIQIQKKSLKLWINLSKGKLDDPKKLSVEVDKKGHHGNGDYELTVKNTDNIEYIMSLVKQAI